jgi:hypothetical protein
MDDSEFFDEIIDRLQRPTKAEQYWEFMEPFWTVESLQLSLTDLSLLCNTENLTRSSEYLQPPLRKFVACLQLHQKSSIKFVKINVLLMFLWYM